VRVFVLCTGRCGSSGFAKACTHISNFTSAHESRLYGCPGNMRLTYRDNHIEVDPRLAWYAGRMDKKYGKKPFYVHLIRDRSYVAKSFVEGVKNANNGGDKRGHQIMNAYAAIAGSVDESIAEDFYDTVNANIEHFLKDKPLTMRFEIEKAEANWPVFWRRIGAEGNMADGLNEFAVRHNARGTK